MSDHATFTASELFINDGNGWIPLDHVGATPRCDLVLPDAEFRISRELLTSYSFTAQITKPARNRMRKMLYRLLRRSEGRDKRYARRMRRHEKHAKAAGRALKRKEVTNAD